MMLGKTEVRPNRPRDGRHCDLCGCSQPAVRCDKCGCQIFCLSCDDMYHRHPKRRFHLRKAVDPTPPTPQARPVLPMKIAHIPTSPGDPSKMPLPPPRKKKPTKSFFDTFRRRSPSSDNSPPLPKKEYSWTDRLGNIKKFMSNRPLPPLPNNNAADENDLQESMQSTKNDLSFIHKRVDDRPPQLPQRSLKPNEFSRPGQGKENFPEGMHAHLGGEVRNGNFDPSLMNRNHEFNGGIGGQWNNNTMENHQMNTLNRQFQPANHGGPGFPPRNFPQSASATDLQNLPGMDGHPGMPPPHYPHYPMNPHLPPHYPYPMYPPQFQNYPQYFGNSFANLSSQPTTTDGDFSDHSEASSRHHSGKKYPFRKRAKRSQSVMVDRMAFPGQFYPFGPFPPGYGPGPWGAPFPMEAPPSPASSIRSLNRVGRTRRRKKLASEDDDEEFSMSSSPMSRPKSSSSDRPRSASKPAPLATQTTSSEEEGSDSENRRDTKGKDRTLRRDSDPRRLPSPVPKSPQTVHKKSSKQSKRDTLKHSDAEVMPVTPIQMDRRPSRDSNRSRYSDAEEIPSSPAAMDRRPSRDSNADQTEQVQGASVWIPHCSWQCKHCTFINAAGNRICQVCCKTATAEGTTLVTSRPNSASSRKQSLSSEKSCSSPEKRMEEEEEDISAKRDNQDMAVLNSALDEAEKEISRGLEELMKLKEDFSAGKSQEKVTHPPPSKPPTVPEESTAKPVYKSTGKMRTSILDKIISTPKQSAASTSTETQTGSNSNTDRILEARRPSTSSTTSDAYNSPIAQSPQLDRMDMSSNKQSGAISKSGVRKDSSCQTQMDDLMDYIERKKVEEEAYFARPSNGYGFRYGDRMDTVTSPTSFTYDRGYGMMQRSHSRASLFTGRLNDFGPVDYGLGPAPMYRSVSRGSLTGDYPESRFSEFQNLRKPDYYLSMEELVERRRQESVRAQGLELVRMIREAEQQGFTADDIQVALNNCGKQNPLEWLQENWKIMVENVINLSTSYANDKKENDIGTVSENEARDALRLHKGHIWASVTECVETRQRKFLELKARGKFNSKDITDALTSCQGDVELAYAKLTKSTSKPFLMRIWGAGEGAQNQDGAIPKPTEIFKSYVDPYYKDNLDVDDVQSDELWDEEEEDVEWDEDYEEDDEEEHEELDLQTCREELRIPNDVTTPDSDRSDYCDAFGSNTLERNMSSSGSGFTSPDCNQVKKGNGFLSKLVALRKEDKETKQPSAKFFDEELEPSSTAQNGEDDDFGPADEQKSYNPLTMIKSTISAIRDSVSGSSNSEKKRVCAAPERRTIIVRDQVAHESMKEDNNSVLVKQNSVRPLKEDYSKDTESIANLSGAILKQTDAKDVSETVNKVDKMGMEMGTPRKPADNTNNSPKNIIGTNESQILAVEPFKVSSKGKSILPESTETTPEDENEPHMSGEEMNSLNIKESASKLLQSKIKGDVSIKEQPVLLKENANSEVKQGGSSLKNIKNLRQPFNSKSQDITNEERVMKVKEKSRREKEEAEEKERKETERKEIEERERIVKAKQEKERIEKENREKLEKERIEKVERERIENERKEKEERDRIQKERKEKEERDRIEKERKEKEERERIELERKEKEERERIELERKEKEERERIEMERKEKEERERLEKERKEKEEIERIEKERKEKEERDKVEIERKEKETDRVVKDKKEQEEKERKDGGEKREERKEQKDLSKNNKEDRTVPDISEFPPVFSSVKSKKTDLSVKQTKNGKATGSKKGSKLSGISSKEHKIESFKDESGSSSTEKSADKQSLEHCSPEDLNIEVHCNSAEAETSDTKHSNTEQSDLEYTPLENSGKIISIAAKESAELNHEKEIDKVEFHNEGSKESITENLVHSAYNSAFSNSASEHEHQAESSAKSNETEKISIENQQLNNKEDVSSSEEKNAENKTKQSSELPTVSTVKDETITSSNSNKEENISYSLQTDSKNSVDTSTVQNDPPDSKNKSLDPSSSNTNNDQQEMKAVTPKKVENQTSLINLNSVLNETISTSPKDYVSVDLSASTEKENDAKLIATATTGTANNTNFEGQDVLDKPQESFGSPENKNSSTTKFQDESQTADEDKSSALPLKTPSPEKERILIEETTGQRSENERQFSVNEAANHVSEVNSSSARSDEITETSSSTSAEQSSSENIFTKDTFLDTHPGLRGETNVSPPANMTSSTSSKIVLSESAVDNRTTASAVDNSITASAVDNSITTSAVDNSMSSTSEQIPSVSDNAIPSSSQETSKSSVSGVPSTSRDLPSTSNKDSPASVAEKGASIAEKGASLGTGMRQSQNTDARNHSTSSAAETVQITPEHNSEISTKDHSNSTLQESKEITNTIPNANAAARNDDFLSSDLKSSTISSTSAPTKDTLSAGNEASSKVSDPEEESDSSDDNSFTPPSPVDALRHRFEGLMSGNSGLIGPIRPQSPLRRMSFRSTKAAIALEKTRDISTEKPWYIPKPPVEQKKPPPKRSIKQQLEIERRVRKMVADRKCRTYRKAEIVVQLMDMNFEEEEAIQAANECSTLEQAISFLQQECLLCTGHYPVSHIVSMVHCQHKACRDCIRAYFTVQIRDRNIMELLCPFCNEPDIFDDDIAQDYFNHLDIMLKKLVDPDIHELFQRKLRDRVLMRDPNFRWCSQCSSGFIAMENLRQLVCPDCNAVMCASCRRPWEREHQGISCEAFASLKDSTDPEAQAAGLAKLLTEDGIDCPMCHFRYALAKGGCMHFRCTQCQHDFCSGCSRPFKMGQKCGVSEFCAKLGLHAHHPRNCLFYLRDKEPEDLQKLLDLSNVKYDIDPPDGMDVKRTCQVMEQKETSDGMMDDYCGKDVEDGFAGLCRVHYVEYLGQLVNKHKVDPIQIFEIDDLELVLRRANIRLPYKRYRESDIQYREKLVKLIEEELPLDKMDGS